MLLPINRYLKIVNTHFLTVPLRTNSIPNAKKENNKTTMRTIAANNVLS